MRRIYIGRDASYSTLGSAQKGLIGEMPIFNFLSIPTRKFENGLCVKRLIRNSAVKTVTSNRLYNIRKSNRFPKQFVSKGRKRKK